MRNRKINIDLFGVGKGGYVSKVLKNGILLPSVSLSPLVG